MDDGIGIIGATLVDGVHQGGGRLHDVALVGLLGGHDLRTQLLLELLGGLADCLVLGSLAFPAGHFSASSVVVDPCP